MANLNVDIVRMEKKVVYGIWKKTNDKTISADIKDLSQKYDSCVSKPRESVLPYFVISRNYDEQSGNSELLIGSIYEGAGLDSFILPAGEYAKITVRPKLGFLWGASIGEAKRFLYTKWIPESDYVPLNMEYEFHTEKSTGKHPEIDIIFALERKR